MLNKLKRVLCILLIITIFCGMLCACYDRREIDDLAYVIAIGLDKGKTSKLKMTLQLAVPTAIGGGGEGGGGEAGDKATSILTLETQTVFSGLNLANNFISRQINLSHAKALVFSSEIAKEGIGDLLNGFSRGRELRPNTHVVISRSSAEDYIKAVKPQLEINPAKYYELNLESFRYTGFISDTIFHNFYIQAKACSQQPVATLAGVGKFKDSDEFNLEGSTYIEKGKNLPLEGDFKAGDLPKTSKLQAEVMGLAVFNGSNMVGELDGEEAIYYNMLSNRYSSAFVTLPDPLSKNRFIVLNIKKSRNPVHTVDLNGDKPLIKVKISLEADIQVIQSGINYEKPEKTEIIEKAYESFIREGIQRLLNRTAMELNSDIIGFGNYAKPKFLVWKDWIKYDWLSKYKNSTFDVKVDLKIRRPGLKIRTAGIPEAN